MASLVGTTSSNPAEQIQLLKTQATAAFAQQKGAEKVAACFAECIKNNQTPENLGKYQELLTKAMEAAGHAAELRRKVSDAELAYYNPKNQCLAQDGSGSSLADRQVAEIDLSGTPGYFPE
jgi:hypothetical protein